MFNTLLVPVDGSKSSHKLLHVAAETAKAFSAQIKLLYVIEPVPHQFVTMTVDDSTMMTKVADSIIKDALAQLDQEGINEAETHVLTGDPANTILNFVKDGSVDLVVLGTHGWRGLDRLLLGSVAAEVVRSSKVPVMTIRLKETE